MDFKLGEKVYTWSMNAEYARVEVVAADYIVVREQESYDGSKQRVHLFDESDLDQIHRGEKEYDED